jgi:hypothetical protein
METTNTKKKRKPMSLTQKVRRMVVAGYDNKTIIQKLNCKPYVIYNVRYTLNKSQGLGGLVQTKPEVKSPEANDVLITPVATPEAYPLPPSLIPVPQEKLTLLERIRRWFRG